LLANVIEELLVCEGRRLRENTLGGTAETEGRHPGGFGPSGGEGRGLIKLLDV
jgi:hypothetical protein